MPVYCYSCSEHGVFEYVCSIDERNENKQCWCGKTCQRDVAGENQDRGDIAAMNGKERFSRSMGVLPKRIPEMMIRYPGSEYDFRTGDLKINGRLDKLKKMRERNMQEF